MSVVPPSIGFRSNNEQVNWDLVQIVADLEARFPNRISSYYLIGSQAEGQPLPTSDTDVVIVVRELTDLEEVNRRVRSIYDRLQNRVDLWTLACIQLQDQLYVETIAALTQGSELLFGVDLRESLPEPDPEAFARWATRKGIEIVDKIRPDEAIRAGTTLRYPDATDTFLGYVWHGQLTSMPIGVTQTTKPLAQIWQLGLMAILASDYRLVAITRRRVAHSAVRFLDPELAADFEVLQSVCRQALHYLVPEESEHRDAFRRLCSRTLSIEQTLVGHADRQGLLSP